MNARLPIFILALVIGASTPAVAAGEPMPIDSISPTNGGVYPPTASGVAFELKSPVMNMHSMFVEVSTQNIPGQDGTLADDFRVDAFPMFRSDAYPGTYRGGSNMGAGWWPDKSGTYYWQVRSTCSYYFTPPCSAANPPDQYRSSPNPSLARSSRSRFRRTSRSPSRSPSRRNRQRRPAPRASIRSAERLLSGR